MGEGLLQWILSPLSGTLYKDKLGRRKTRGMSVGYTAVPAGPCGAARESMGAGEGHPVDFVSELLSCHLQQKLISFAATSRVATVGSSCCTPAQHGPVPARPAHMLLQHPPAAAPHCAAALLQWGYG